MSVVLNLLPPRSRVAIVRLRSLGDCVLTTPALHLLKSARPDLELAIVVEDRFAEVFRGNPEVSAILPPSLRALRAFAPDLCLNLHGGSTSARLTALSGAKFRAGFAHFRKQLVYNVSIPTAQETLHEDRKVHTAEHLASAVFHLGVPVQEVPRARLFAQAPAQLPAYAVIHPTASAPEKTWPSAFFLSIAQHVQRALDLDPVFIGGPGEDLTPFQVWPTRSSAPLAEIKSLLSGASLFVGNDSGPAHMAAAFGVPAVVLYGPSDPVVWAPWRTPAEVLIADGPIHSISEQEVIRALDRMRVMA